MDMPVQTTSGHRVVIVGGGFGGLYAARNLTGADVDVTLIDKRNFHLFQPLLYQVATGGLSPGDICSPIRAVLKRNKSIRTLMAEVTGFDLERRLVKTSEFTVPYDTLIVAAGAENMYFGNDHWSRHAPGLKSIEDALEIRRRVLTAFEAAEKSDHDEQIKRLLTFAVVGAGPTGVELAGALSEIARYVLKNEFRNIDPTFTRVILIDGSDEVLPGFEPPLATKARTALKNLGVDVRTGIRVTDIGPAHVKAVDHKNNELRIEAGTVIWAAGVKPSGLGMALTDDKEGLRDRTGRVKVEPDLSLPGHPEVLVIGDLAHCSHQTGEPLPGLAPVAMQQGRYVARLIRDRLAGRSTKPFRYADKGNLATIGRNRAVGRVGPFKLSGALAWLTWLFVHLMYIVEFGNRLVVFVQWAWEYLTWSRGARLITKDVFTGPDSELVGDDSKRIEQARSTD